MIQLSIMPTLSAERRAEHNRKYYQKNKAKVVALNQANKKRNLDHVTKIKEESPCMDCGRFFPACAMDFDHVVGEKFKDIASMVANGHSLAAIDAEIAKCELVCACCHRIRTRDRLINASLAQR